MLTLENVSLNYGSFTALNGAWQGLAARWQIAATSQGSDGSDHLQAPLAHLGFAFYDASGDSPLPNARLLDGLLHGWCRVLSPQQNPALAKGRGFFMGEARC